MRDHLVIRAKPLEWEPAGDKDWCAKGVGYYIAHNGDEEPDHRWHASLGDDDGEDFPTLDEAKAWCWQQLDEWVRQMALMPPLLLKGIGKINGDGWKDTTRIGEVVYAWNRELPEPYAPGQFPRLGNPIWSASNVQYAFRPVDVDEAIAVIDHRIEELRTEVGGLTDELRTFGGFNMLSHLRRQIAFSASTFGPGDRTAGVCDHIRKELAEVQADAAAGKPTLSEWVDVIILAFDGAWRSGASPEEIVAAIVAKQTKNEGRTWPDWRTADPGKAIEHDRSGEAPA